MSKGKQQEEEARHDVFIAHVEEDADVALEIALGLEEAGYSTWCYEVDNIPGPSYLVQTGQRIEQAKAVVVVISPHSIGSHQVTREVVRAHESGKYFVPVRRDISHIEFQNRQPEWREAIGAATSIGVPKEGGASIVPRIIAGLKNLGIQPATKADSVRIEQIYKGISELLVPTKGLELERGPAEAAKETPDLTDHVETPVKGLKRVTNLRWSLIAGVLLCLGFTILIFCCTIPYTVQQPWYDWYFFTLIFTVPLLASGAYCLRRGIAQAHVSKLAQAKIPGWWWLLPIVLGPFGGMIAWLKQRDVDWRKASNLLTLGIVLSVFWVIPFLVLQVPATSSTPPTQTHTLTINISPSGAGSVSPSGGEYESGEQVTLTASPASGYIFDHWSGSATGATSTITITVDSDKTLTAHFSEALFSDDFSNPDSGWERASYEEYDCGYVDGEYHILVKTDYWVAWSQNPLAGRFTDFVLEIDARLVSESNKGSYGVIFRFQDSDNFYRFEIEDGYYLVGTKTGGVWTELQGWTESASIKEGHDRNHLKVVATGPKIEVYANGHHLTTVTDDSFAEGYVGVIVDTDKAGADAAFDNIKVYSLD